MLRLRAAGLGIKSIARKMDCSLGLTVPPSVLQRANELIP
jgi:hypothetical protein